MKHILVFFSYLGLAIAVMVWFLMIVGYLPFHFISRLADCYSQLIEEINDGLEMMWERTERR